MKANNKIVWILAFAPLLGLMLESAVAGAAASHPAAVEAAVADALHHGTYWYLTLGLNLALLLWEARRLKAAGVAMSSLGKWAFVVPVYLWQRARLLGQKATYFYTWLTTFGLALLIGAGAGEVNRHAGDQPAGGFSAQEWAEFQRKVAEPVDVAALLKKPDTAHAVQTPAGTAFQVLKVEDNQTQTVAGPLEVVVKDPSGVGPKVLLLDRRLVPGIEDDHLTLLALFRYADRDTLLYTHACGGSGCGYTAIGLLEITPTGDIRRLESDDLTINTDGAEPGVQTDDDGGVVLSYDGFKGPQRWRYHQGSLSKY